MEKPSLWMGDLERWMDESWLKQLWLSYGFMTSVKVIRNRQTGFNSGYCFVDFLSLSEASRALAWLNGHPIPNTVRIFKLNWASGSSGFPAVAVEYTIHVSDLPVEMNEYQLMALFLQRYPSCKGAKIVTDPLTHLSKGYGFVKFADEVEQQRALVEMNGQYLGGICRIRCSPAQSRVISAGNSFGHQASTSAYRSAIYTPTYAVSYQDHQ
jgi:RNA recognition motif-containing protein